MTNVAGGFAGRARSTHSAPDPLLLHEGTPPSRASGLYAIDLQEFALRVLVHELAHAWVHTGPPAIVEGATNLLTDCALARAPQAFVGLVEVDEPHLPGRLERWENNDGDTATVRSSYYAASYRFMRAVAEVIPERRLWNEVWSWDTLRGALSGAGGEWIRDVLDGDAEAERAALADEDRDGLANVHERRLGTDPADWDTDRDGWWDGAPLSLRRSDGVVPLPPDDSPVCTSGTAGPLGAFLFNRSAHPTYVWVGGRRHDVKPGRWVHVPSHAALAFSRRRLGASVAPERRSAARPNLRCVSTREGTVMAATAEAAVTLPLYTSALAAVSTSAHALLRGPGPRASFVLGAAAQRPVRGVVFVADRRGTPIEVVADAVAELRLQASSLQAREAIDRPLVRALAHDLIADPAVEIGALPEETEDWIRVARACPSGWRGVLDGACTR